MKTPRLPIALLLLGASGLCGQSLVSYDFNEAAGTGMTGLSPSVGTETWNNNLTGVATDGSGSIVNSGSSAGATHLDVADLTSGIYTLSLTGVRFNGVGGGTDDVVAFGFRSFNSGAKIGTSSADSLTLAVGNINDGGGIDAAFRIAGADGGTVSDFTADFSGTYDFYVEYDLDLNVGRMYLDSGSGISQIGSDLSVSAAANLVALTHAVTDFGGGDQILVDGYALNSGAVPEPSTYSLVAGLAGLALLGYRRLSHFRR